jgi:quercetin dioxygenase-like cupin family protein
MKKSLTVLGVVAAAISFVIAAEESKTAEHRVLNPPELTWGEVPPGLPSGGKMAVLNGDPTKEGAFTVRLKGSAGYIIPPHTHPTTERVTVMSGTFEIGMGEKMDKASMKQLGPGGYVVLPSGMAHYAKMKEASIVQIDSEGPFQINYVNPADDPRNKTK